MTKTDLIAKLEKKVCLTHEQAKTVINICFESMIKALYNNERIEIRGFGTFVNRNYKSYISRDPKDGRKVVVGPKKVPFFRAGKKLREIINQSKKECRIQEE